MSHSDIDKHRRAIDQLDDAMLDLLAKRIALGQQIGAAKEAADGPHFAFRPAREAAVMRRLIKAAGSLPPRLVFAAWRAVMSGTARLQAPLRLEIPVAGPDSTLRDLALAHFSAGMPTVEREDTKSIVTSVSANPNVLGILPFPESDDVAPWWIGVAVQRPTVPRVIAALPFVSATGPVDAFPKALVIGQGGGGPSGDDVTLLSLIANLEFSRDGITEALQKSDLKARDIASFRPPSGRPLFFHLFALPGYLSEDDGAFIDLRARLGEEVREMHIIGGYARPLVLSAELS